ncbi:MAG: AAA family ATPase [bacterium]|nr:AAA family ATPase [bacterium]
MADGQNSDILQEQTDELRARIESAQLPEGIKEKCLGMIERIARMAKFGTYSIEYENTSRYIDVILSIPWYTSSPDILDTVVARAALDKHQYGLESVKIRVLEYLAVLQLHQYRKQQLGQDDSFRAPVIMLVGLAGTGKTTFAYAVADAMNRKVARIPFGGMGDALTLRGQSRAFADAEPGAVIKALIQAGTRNPVVLLDEIDRVSDEARANIMGVLLELLDPQQNVAYRDHYVDFPVDLSECLFIATGNNTTNISTAVLDRLEIIQMPSYTDEEKITIASTYVFPRALQESGLPPNAITIDPAVWPQVVRPLGFDSGIRTLERTIRGMCRKVARMIVEGNAQQVHVTAENVKEFLPTW